MNHVTAAQKYLAEENLDGWLLYDFHKTNPLAIHFLNIEHMVTRRFFYWIPRVGEPTKIVHAIEAGVLDAWPGKKRIYSSWQTLETTLRETLSGHKRVAMEYSPNNAIPYLSKVDAGTIELIRSMGVEVASSGNFLLHFTSVLTEAQMQSQRRAARALEEIVEEVWHWIPTAPSPTERSIQEQILEQFERRKLITDAPPIVAVNEHSADPHFETPRSGSTKLKAGDWLLIDLWAKEATPGAVFGDLTKVAVLAPKPTARQQQVFDAVRAAQKAAIQLARTKRPLQGWEVDEAARDVLRKAGFGKEFLHRTGHNIEVELHGSGTHMDNLETHDTRPVLPMTCFSVEPGVYLPGEFGVRLENDVLVWADGRVEVTGGEQDVVRCFG